MSCQPKCSFKLFLSQTTSSPPHSFPFFRNMESGLSFIQFVHIPMPPPPKPPPHPNPRPPSSSTFFHCHQPLPRDRSGRGSSGASPRPAAGATTRRRSSCWRCCGTSGDASCRCLGGKPNVARKGVKMVEVTRSYNKLNDECASCSRIMMNV